MNTSARLNDEKNKGLPFLNAHGGIVGEVFKAHSLIGTSKEWAHRALAAYQNNDNAIAIALAGISWEHLCKACLCSVNPILVTTLTNDNRKNWQVLVQIMGLDMQGPGGPTQTIDPIEAQTRVRELYDLQFDSRLLQQLIGARNSVLHSGLLPGLDLNLIIAEFLRASNEILRQVSVNRSDQWGEYNDFVDQLLADNLREIDAHVKRKLARARAKLAELRENFPDEMWEEFTYKRQTRTSDETALLFDRPLGLKGAVKLSAGAALKIGPRFDPSTCIVRDECPVCSGEQGAYLGHLTQTGEDTWIFRSQRFWCGLCELSLDTAEEMRIGAGGREKKDIDEGCMEDILGPYWRDNLGDVEFD